MVISPTEFVCTQTRYLRKFVIVCRHCLFSFEIFQINCVGDALRASARLTKDTFPQRPFYGELSAKQTMRTECTTKR